MSSESQASNPAPAAANAPAAPPAAPLSPIRAAIQARVLAKKKAAAKPPPPAGRKAQELDHEAPSRLSSRGPGNHR